MQETPTTPQSTPRQSTISEPTPLHQQAASSLSLLLEEDPLLIKHNLIKSKHDNDQDILIHNVNEEAAFSYAASLLSNNDISNWMDDGIDVNEDAVLQNRASEALEEVDRKLALVQSLYERVARESPEAVSKHLLSLHGFDIHSIEEELSKTTSLTTTRDKCDRIKRQGEMLEGVVKRVESSLTKGLRRMESSTTRLSRVLQLSSVLKMIMRLQFELKKAQGCGIQDQFNSYVDLRDLTRASACVASMEELLHQLDEMGDARIDVVERMRPQAESIATAVRNAARGLLKDPLHQQYTSKLGSILQVYFHLNELSQAVWGEVSDCLSAAEKISSHCFSPSSLSKIMMDAKNAVEQDTGKTKTMKERELKKRIREKRGDAARVWAQGLLEPTKMVWNLHRVLVQKSDPISRQNFYTVFAKSTTPDIFQPADKQLNSPKDLFAIYWRQVCITLGSRITRILKYDNGSLARDVAALYPSIRSAALSMLSGLLNEMQATAATTAMDDHVTQGIMGGSDILDESFFLQANRFVAGADSWTHQDYHQATSTPILSTSTISSPEWSALRGDESTYNGLYPLEKSFLEASYERLASPLQYLFPEAVHIEDENANTLPVLPTLPSRYDIAKLDANIREELAIADPREGGGELGMTVMLSENVVDMVKHFCNAARNATSEAGEQGYLNQDGTPTEALEHDLKHLSVISSLSQFLRNAPDKTFIAPYRPASLPQYDEAARMCHMALRPAIKEMDDLSKSLTLTPLCKAINTRLSAAISKLHYGTYMEENYGNHDDASFVQQHLTPLYEEIASLHLAKLPSDYATIVASSIAIYSIYSFVSNAALVRPLGETGRLRITQDLADLELALEQLVLHSSNTLGQLDSGRPYAELRAMRQMIFWNGLYNKQSSAATITKELLHEIWIKDVRPSTILHFLFSFATNLLSSPHHSKRLSAGDYVEKFLLLDFVDTSSTLNENEEKAWVTTISCCDAFFQRESVGSGEMSMTGDGRVARILMSLGPELLRSRRQFFEK